jgi:MFS family permease
VGRIYAREVRSSGSHVERRLVLVVGAVVLVDTMFYAAIAPLLPALAHEFRLSKLSAGVLTASYAVGMLVGSLPGGLLAARVGPKRAVYVGLTLLGASTLAFGFVQSAVGLGVARFVEGVGGACSWAGGLAWIVAESREERRGAMIGRAVGAAIGGALLGPVIGTVANAIGRGATFSGVVVLAVALIVAVSRIPLAHGASGQGLAHGASEQGLAHGASEQGPAHGAPGRGVADLSGALRSRAIVAGVWLVALPAVASGLVNVLGPLRLHRLGAAAAAIGATFLAGAAIEAAMSPAVGSLSDRRGRFVPMRFGLAGAAALLACFTLPASAAALAVLIVALAATLGTFWAPAMALLADAAAARGLDQALAAALMNVAWAAGQIVGSGVGGALAKAAGDALPMLLTAGACAATLALLKGRGAVRGDGRG